MDFKDLKTRSPKELNEMLVELRSELHELRTQAYSRTLKQFHKIQNNRKTIAKILTALRQMAK